MRLLPIILAGFILLESAGAKADGNTLFGSPVVQGSGEIMLEGREIQLWGINVLAGDQQCWRDDLAWSCGDQAATALKHYVVGQIVKCNIKDYVGAGTVSAQCFRQQGGVPEDIARYMVVQGWAMDDTERSGGLYAHEQEDARKQRRGIWTSRFQTAADWRDGVQHFVSYTMEPKPEMTPKTVNQTTVNNTNTTVYPVGYTKIIINPPITEIHNRHATHPRKVVTQPVADMPEKKFDNPGMQKTYDHLRAQVHNQAVLQKEKEGIPTSPLMQVPGSTFDNPEMQKTYDRTQKQIRQNEQAERARQGLPPLETTATGQ